jgi:phage shock protein PspC (stress-responsive transcriptional regulator)
MKKIININLSSRLIPIEDSAYELLKSYLDSLKTHFSREEGGEEIVSDIEDRIAEVFQERLKKGAHCITDEDVNAMVSVMGRPEQLEEETATEPTGKRESAREEAPPVSSRKLRRNENDKVLGGICSGIAAYLGIDPVVVRIVTFLLMWAWGFGFLLYIILWIVLPSSRALHNPVHKRLYRNPDNKVIGGVCSGIGAYLNVEPVIIRVAFVLPLLGIIFSSIFHHWLWLPSFFFPLSVGFLPTLIVLYVVLWISIPKAKTVTEKLEMRGEKVDLQSITNAMKGSQEEKKNDSGEQPPILADHIAHDPLPTYSAASTGRSGLGEVLITMLKFVAYFILAIFVIGLCIVLIGLAGGFIGTATSSSLMLPYTGLILYGSTQHILAWPAILLTLGIPVVAIIWLFIKLFTGFKPRNHWVGLSLFLGWIAGVICAVWLSVSLAKDFRTKFRETTPVAIQQPVGQRLILRQQDSNVHISGWNVLKHVIELGEDSARLKTIRISIDRSADDSFRVEIMRASNGRSVSQARMFAENIGLNVIQQDSILYIPEGFAISRDLPFRNQQIVLRIAVPQGKYIQLDRALEKRRGGHWDFDDDWDDWDQDWNDRPDNGKDYEMTPSGLKSAGTTDADTTSDSADNTTYRYH